ncbi:MAG: hypothetical protein J2O49_05320 [Sciscionella sp.]|nr:hypothetical protein [Sciscionella sp.]
MSFASFSDAGARFDAEVAAALTKARRAAADARSLGAEFRRQTKQAAQPPNRPLEPPVGPAQPTPHRPSPAVSQVQSGGPSIERKPLRTNENRPNAPRRPARAVPDDDDDDFSQHTYTTS